VRQDPGLLEVPVEESWIHPLSAKQAMTRCMLVDLAILTHQQIPPTSLQDHQASIGK
jgi:hypothetical protein